MKTTQFIKRPAPLGTRVIFRSPRRLRSVFGTAIIFSGLITGLDSAAKAGSITSTATVATNVANWTNWTTAQLEYNDISYSDTGTNATATGTLSGFNFSAIPASAAIEGLEVTIQASETNASVDGFIQTALSWDNGSTYSVDSRSPDSGELNTYDAAFKEGNSATTWGHSWTVAEATAALKVRIWAYDASTTVGYVTRIDNVKVTLYYDDGPPGAATNFTSVQSSTATGQINLSWTSSGDNGSAENLTGNYRIQYATYTALWSTSSTPSNATTVTIATTNAVPGSNITTFVSGLSQETTHYFVLWSQDNLGLWSGISNTTSTFLDLTSPSTSTLLATTNLETGKIDLSWTSAGDDGSSGNLTGIYLVQYATFTANWSTTTTPTDATTYPLYPMNVAPGSAQSCTITGLTSGPTYYFVLWSRDDGGNWSAVSNTSSAQPVFGVIVVEAQGQAGWIVQGENQKILGIVDAYTNNTSGVTISSVSLQSSGYTADGNLINVEVWASSSGYIDANAIRLEDTAKAFSSNAAVFTQNVTVSTTPLYFIARADVSGSATEGTFDISMELFAATTTANNPLAFTNATEVLAPPNGAPSGLTATAESNLLRVNLTWNDTSSNEDYFAIYRSTHSGVSSSDYLVGFSATASFADDSIPPNQQVYYTVYARNRAGGSSASASASATSVDLDVLTKNNIYKRAGAQNGGYSSAVNGSLSSPSATAIDSQQNLYIVDSLNNLIRFVPKSSGTHWGQPMTAGCIYTIAGSGGTTFDGDNGLATTKSIGPNGIALDAQGNLYIGDGNLRVRFVPRTSGMYWGQGMTANYIYTIAGAGSTTFDGDGSLATSKNLSQMRGLSIDAQGNLYITSAGHRRIRFVPRMSGTYWGQGMTANYIYTIAGDGGVSYDEGGGVPATSKSINPTGVAFDTQGNLYATEMGKQLVRFVPKTSGTYWGQSMTANYIYTIAGSGNAGYDGDDAVATSKKLKVPYSLSLDAQGNLYLADYSNNRIRFVPKASGTYWGQSMTANFIYTIAGSGGTTYDGDDAVATTKAIYSPRSTTLDAQGNLYLAEYSNNRIRFVPKTSGTYWDQSMTANYIYTIVGNGSGYNGDNDLATSKNVPNPAGVVVDTQGNLYFSNGNANRVRFVPKASGTYWGQSMTSNFVYTIAGSGGSTYDGDAAPATSKNVFWAYGLSLDAQGNLYIAEYGGYRVRFVPKNDGTYWGQTMTANNIYTIAGNGTGGYDGDDGPATSKHIISGYYHSLDTQGNLYMGENSRVRFVPRTSGTYWGQSMTANYIYTIAGSAGGQIYNGDGALATSKYLYGANSVRLDAHGNLCILDTSNYRVRFVPKSSGTFWGQTMTANFIYTIAGNGVASYDGDNAPATTKSINYSQGMSLDAQGNLYIADRDNNRIRFVPNRNGTYFGQTMTANYIYTIGGTGNPIYDGENAASTGKNINNPKAVFTATDHNVYLTDLSNQIRMIAGEDFIAPSTSTLSATAGESPGNINMSWASAGDDNVNLGNLTGTYRIQYATFTAAWSATSTPADATTLSISTTNAVPGVVQSTTIAGLTSGTTYYFALFTGDEVPNWSDVSNTASAMPPNTVTLAEAVDQAGWMGQGETQRILGTAEVVSDSSTGVTISSVAVQASGYTADGNLTNVEVWLSSSGYIDANAIRLENTAKAFSSNTAAFTQDVTISTTPYYLIARADVSGSAAEGAFDIALQIYTTAVQVNNPIAFSNTTDVVAPPSSAPSGLTATASGNLLQVNLSWGASTGADSYTIYRATHSGVTTSDFLLAITTSTTYPDDYIPPNQQMYYKVVGTNRAGASSLSSAANATSVDVPALTTSNIYLRGGVPGRYGDGSMAYGESFNYPTSTYVDSAGNLYIADQYNNRIRFVPKKNGTYFGQTMSANSIYTIAGDGTEAYATDNVAATSTGVYYPAGVSVDTNGNLYIADQYSNRIRFVPTTGGTYFGQSMTANYIYTIAGNGTGGYVADDVAATSTQVNAPYGVSVDVGGNVYIADYGNYRIRFIPKTGGTYFGQSMTANYIYTIAGNGMSGYVADNVAATSAKMSGPTGVSVDVGGNVHIADRDNNRIRFVPKSGGTYFGQPMKANFIYTIVGNGTPGYVADNVAATSTRISSPSESKLDAEGNIYIADYDNNRIRFVPMNNGTYFGQSMTANNIYTIAGNGTPGYVADNVAATSTELYFPHGVSADAGGNVYISDSSNNRIRFIPKNSGTHFGQSMIANNIFTVAGNLTAGDTADNQGATSTQIFNPRGVSVDANGNLYIADVDNHRIRFIPKTGGTYFGQTMTANYIYTIAGNGTAGYVADGVAATSTQIYYPNGVSVDASGNVYITDSSNSRIRFIPKDNGTYFGQSMTANYIYTIAGNGTGGYVADDVAATSTQIYTENGVSVDASGNLYLPDKYNHRIRFIPKDNGTYFGQSMTANYIYTIAGNGTGGYVADDVAATAAPINYSAGVSADVEGNIYIADAGNNRVRFVPKNSGTYFGQSMTATYIYTIAGNGTAGYLADGVAATATQINGPNGVGVDIEGNVYIADSNSHRIRFIPKSGGTYFGQVMTANYIYTIGGTGSTPYNGENAVATGRNIYQPSGVFPASDHMVYLTDTNNKIRMIAGEDFIGPSTSTLAATAGSSAGKIDLSWASAGDDMVNLGNLTGTYRIQYATFSAVWSAGVPPADVTTLNISTTNVTPGVVQSTSIAGLTSGTTYYFALFTGDEVPNWSDVSNTASAMPPNTVTLAEAVGQAGWMGQGETQRILGTAQVVSDSSTGVTISSVAVQASGYTADGNLTNVEVWLSSSGYIDANAIRLENTAKGFTSNIAVFTQDVSISTTPYYLIARADVSGSATEGTFDTALQVYTTALTTNNPISFTNATDVVAPPNGTPSGLTVTAASNLLRVNLTWNDTSSNEDFFAIYRATYSAVSSSDFLVGLSSTSSISDDSIPPNQQMYYAVCAHNRAAASSASASANATSVDIDELTKDFIYLRAGTPGGNSNNDNVKANSGTLNTQNGITVDPQGNLYIADTNNGRIRFVPMKTGVYWGQSMTANFIYSIAGSGANSYDGDDAMGTSKKLGTPYGVSLDAQGNLYIADSGNNRIRFVPKTSGTYWSQSMTANYIYTIAGNGTAGYLADNVAATSTQINFPYGVSVDAGGNVYIADNGNNRIRFVPKTSGTYWGQSMTANYIYTIAGSGSTTYDGDNALATSKCVKAPTGVSLDVQGNLCIADKGSFRIRFVPKNSGTYWGQSMTANYIYTIAGTGGNTYDGDDAIATSKSLGLISGLNLDSQGNLYIADYLRKRIRFVPKASGTYWGQSMTANYIYTIAGNGTSTYNGDNALATSKGVSPKGVSLDGQGNLFISNYYIEGGSIRFVPRRNGTYWGQTMTANYIYTIVGAGASSGYDGNDGLTTNKNLNLPKGTGRDTQGNLYIADPYDRRIRFVPKTSGTYWGQNMTANFIYTIAGNGVGTYDGDNAIATSKYTDPYGVDLDAEGNFYIADYGTDRIRFVPKVSGTYWGQSMTANYIYSIAGTGAWPYNGDNAIATSKNIYSPHGLALDAQGNLYIAGYGNYRIRFVPKSDGTYWGQSMTANYIYTIAGSGGTTYDGDNAIATSKSLYPFGVRLDFQGNLYIADSAHFRIRFVPKTSGTYWGQSMTANFIYTIAGTGVSGYDGDDAIATSKKLAAPSSTSLDAMGNLYIADYSNNRIRFVPIKSGMYFGQSMTANYIYTIGGTGNTNYDGENSLATGKNIYQPYGVFVSPDHMVYVTDENHKVRMIAGEDFIAPSTSTLAVTAGVEQVTLSWDSAGDDNVNLGNLTGAYRIQYATFTAAWSATSTPADATTLSLSTTNVVPGVVQSTTIAGLTAGTTYYFALFTGDEVPNWSEVSNTTSTIPLAPIRSVTITSGNLQAFGVVMMGTQVVGTTGTIVTNDGTLLNTYALRASTQTVGSPWTVKSSTPAGPNQLVLYGLFDGDAAPVEGAFEVDDVIGPENRDSTSAQFSVSGSTTGASVPAGQNRTLWIRLDAPTTSTTVAPQSLKVEITAQPP